MILKPLSDFLNADFSVESIMPDTQQQTGIINSNTNYNQIQDEMLQQSLNRQAEAQIERYCLKEGLVLVSVDVKANADFSLLQEIYLTIKKTGAKSRPFIYIEPSAKDESPEIKRLKNTLSEVYNMSLDNIHISETE